MSTEHYTKNTVAIRKYCPTCNRMTMHSVSGKRVGHCLEHEAQSMTKKQKKRLREQEDAENQQNLF
jgi:ribosomal protein L44E